MKMQFVSFERDRHGNARVYARRHGRRVRIRERPGSAAFVREIAHALERLDRPEAIPTAIKGPARGTLDWIAALYLGSVEFHNLNRVSQRKRRAILPRPVPWFATPGR
jgi:hypothetical protein